MIYKYYRQPGFKLYFKNVKNVSSFSKTCNKDTYSIKKISLNKWLHYQLPFTYLKFRAECHKEMEIQIFHMFLIFSPHLITLPCLQTREKKMKEEYLYLLGDENHEGVLGENSNLEFFK